MQVLEQETAANAIGREFVLAGKAIFTVFSRSGKHYTYRVTSKESDSGSKIWFVGLLTGTDNTSDYEYLGVLKESGEVRLTAKSQHTSESTPVIAIRWAINKLWSGSPIPDGCGIHHEGWCGRCGRMLTDPVSVRTGFGPKCRGRE